MILIASGLSFMLLATPTAAQEAAFAPPHSDSGEDTDGDGRFDLLHVDVKVTVDGTADVYSVHAHLFNHPLNLDTSNLTSLDAGTHTVRVSFDGKSINASGVDGPYAVNLILSVCYGALGGELDCYTSDQDDYTTAAYSRFNFEEPVVFTPPHADTGQDTDGDGRFDSLHVDVSVAVDLAGTYRVEGRLHGDSLPLNLTESNYTLLQVGVHTVRLSYVGWKINRSGIDGPYTVELSLQTCSGVSGECWFLEGGTHTTAVYSHLDFEEPRAYLTPPHADAGQDRDGDGRFDYLAVEVSAFVITAGWYMLYGTLSAGGSPSLADDYNVSSRDVGPATIELLFPGRQLNASGLEGPYTVDLRVSDTSTGTLWDVDTFATAAYSHFDFEEPPAFLAPPHFDMGQDTDGDGRFNYLAVEAHVVVDTAGWYSLNGRLHLGSCGLCDRFVGNVSFLDLGPQTMEVRFVGRAVNESGLDGPYRVDLSIYDYASYQRLASDTHETNPYLHTEFEEIPTIVSSLATTRPSVDGVYSLGEWADASVVDMSPVPGNTLPALLLVKDDSDFLYLAYDVIGDTTMDVLDAASIAFDSWEDGNTTSGQEDIFLQGGRSSDNQTHLIFDVSCYLTEDGEYECTENWIVEDSPYDLNLPNHTGLMSASGFGPSDNSADDHRIYEFKIPFSLLEISSQDTIGFFGGGPFVGGQFVPGVFDASPAASSIWPEILYGPFPLSYYGDLFFGPDLFPPSVAISFPGPDAVLAVDPVYVRWNASDRRSGIDHYEVSLDGGAPLLLPASLKTYAFSGLEEGPHTVSVTAIDLAGNYASDAVTVVVDTSSPTVSIESPAPETLFGTRDVSVIWTASDAFSGLSRIEVSLDGGAPVVLSGDTKAYTFNGIDDGPHAIEVTAFDLAENSGSSSVDVTVDATSPVLSITSPAPGTFFGSGDVPILWVVSDAVSGLDRIELQLDTETPVVLPPDTTTHTFTEVPEGDHVVLVTAYDVADHSATQATSFAVDTSSPSLTILLPVPGFLASSSIDVAWAAQDTDAGLDRIEVQLDADGPISLPANATTYTFPGVADGSHTIVVTAFDLAGNSASDSVTVTVDATPPTLVTDAPQDGAILGTEDVEVSWTAHDSGSGVEHYEVSLDGAAPVLLPPDTTTHTFPGVADGSHTIVVTAFDLAGNSASDSVSVIVDTTAPAVSITAPTPGTFFGGGDVPVTWTAWDAVSGLDRIEVKVDGGTPVVLPPDATGYTFTDLSEGSHTIEVTAFDEAGNSQTASVAIAVDRTAPIAAITTPAPGALLATSDVEVRWTASDSGSGIDHFELILDEAPPIVLAATEAGYTFVGVGDGPHTITMRAFDAVGNIAFVVGSFTVDTGPPFVSIVSPSAGLVAGSTVALTWTVSESLSGVDYLRVSLDAGAPVLLLADATTYTFTGVADGPHTIVVTAVDLAGNSASDSVSVTVDTTAPTVAITSPAGGTFFNGRDVLLVWTASDATSGLDRIEIRLDGGIPISLAAGERSYVFSGLSEGSHTIQVTVSDRAGNSDTRAVSLTIDTIAPGASIVGPATGSVLNSRDVLVSWNVLDTGSGVDRIEVRLDGGPPIVLAGTARTYTFAAVADGVHTVTVIVTDAAGNFGMATAGFAVDTAVWSPSGPYGPVPLTGAVIGLVAAAIGIAVLLQRRRRPGTP